MTRDEMVEALQLALYHLQPCDKCINQDPHLGLSLIAKVEDALKAEPDYRDLLKRYIANVGMNEGVDFLPMEGTDEENELLIQLADRIK